MQFISPLRYPGGKGKLGPFFARLLASQTFQIDSYAEPYAGGAGAGLYLLSEGYINTLLINDLNPGIAAFWRTIIADSEKFVDRIVETDVTLEAWHRQRAIYQNPGAHSSADLGFATFFLNRCNRSGILGARPIGGLDQAGRWKLDARFNKEELATRVRYVGSLKASIRVSELPALQFLKKLRRRKTTTFIYADPPYLVQGDELYMSNHSWVDHEELAKALQDTVHPWVLTYDVDDRVRKLYPEHRCLSYSIKHTAQERKVGNEFMLFSATMNVSDIGVVVKRAGSWLE